LFKERKKETPNSFFFERKFAKGYNTTLVFISDYLKQNNQQIVKSINHIIQDKKISIVLFEGDHVSIFDKKFIHLINKEVKKGLLLQDDYMYHYINRITASACDFIFTPCPVSDIKFKELGYKSFFLPVEADGSIFKNLGQKKIYDVLFFGRVKNNRKEITEYLKENKIKIIECGPKDSISNTAEKLGKLINQSKIVLNFTESDNTNKLNNPLSHYKNYYQLKGRAYFTGMCGTLCISEYAPSIELVFDKNEMPYFTGKEDCLKVVKDYLADNSKLEKQTKIYMEKCLEYEDSKYINNIMSFIEESTKTKNTIEVKVPYWYEFIFFKKNIMLRYRLNKFSPFFKQVYDSIFLEKYTSKFLLPIYVLLGIFISMLFIIKFPFTKLKS